MSERYSTVITEEWWCHHVEKGAGAAAGLAHPWAMVLWAERPGGSSGGFFFFFPCKLMVESSLKQGNGREYILLAVWKDR